MISHHSCAQIFDVFLSSEGCRSPRTFVNNGTFSSISEAYEQLIYFLQLYVGLRTGIAKLLVKYDADSLLIIFYHGNCNDHMLPMFVLSSLVSIGNELYLSNIVQILNRASSQSVPNGLNMHNLVSIL